SGANRSSAALWHTPGRSTGLSPLELVFRLVGLDFVAEDDLRVLVGRDDPVNGAEDKVLHRDAERINNVGSDPQRIFRIVAVIGVRGRHAGGQDAGGRKQ